MCVFFLQAEDGIRDWSVTGVQTCALPISAVRSVDVDPVDANRMGRVSVRPEVRRRARGGDAGVRTVYRVSDLRLRGTASAIGDRSEERRVGKEGRARGWACH